MGRWWREETAEIDVLALDDQTPVLVGECRWQKQPLSGPDLSRLRATSVWVSDTPGAPVFALWSRGGGTEAVLGHPDVRVFTPEDLLPS